MSRLDWIIKCNEEPIGTCPVICMIFQHSYNELGPNDAFRVWLHEIKPKIVGKPRLRVIREALDRRVWEDLC